MSTFKVYFLRQKSSESFSNIRSPAVGAFYDTGIKIWAGFGPIGSTKKKGLG